jgi:hypothetical protein
MWSNSNQIQPKYAAFFNSTSSTTFGYISDCDPPPDCDDPSELVSDVEPELEDSAPESDPLNEPCELTEEPCEPLVEPPELNDPPLEPLELLLDDSDEDESLGMAHPPSQRS